MTSGLPNEVVQFLEVREIGRQDQTNFAKRMCEMNRVRRSRQFRLKGQFHLVAGLPEKGEPLEPALLAPLQPRLVIISDSEFPAPQRAGRPLRARGSRNRGLNHFSRATTAP